MIGTSWIFMFALAVKLITCTKYPDIEPPQWDLCLLNSGAAATVTGTQLIHAISRAQNDSTQQKNLMREFQEWFHYPVWYKILLNEWKKSKSVWSTLTSDLDSKKQRIQCTRIRVWLETLELYFFPDWLFNSTNVTNTTRYEKWIIGCTIYQDERCNIFKLSINDEYGNSAKGGTIALAKAMSDLHAEVSSKILYHYDMPFKVPETDRKIADLCSVVGEPTTIKHLACKLVIKAQSSAIDAFLAKHDTGTNTTRTNPHSIYYGIIKSKNVSETFKVITEHFTNKDSSVTMTGVENCIMKVNLFNENTNLVIFVATCPRAVTDDELEKKLLPLLKTHVLNLELDVIIVS